MTGIFSRYSQGENRVTASITAVLRVLSLPAFSYVVEGFFSEANTDLIMITDQPSRNGKGIPDAIIASSFMVIVEAKMPGNGFNRKQMEGHANRLRVDESHSKRVLIFLTDKDDEPDFTAWKSEQSDRDLFRHVSFAQLYDTLDSLVQNGAIALSDTEEFLLKNLLLMFEAEGLLGRPEDTVVVAAGDTYEANIKYGVYICQPGRSFRDVEHIGFYKDGEIKPMFLCVGSARRGREVVLSDLRNDKASAEDKKLADIIDAYLTDLGWADVPFFQGPFQVFQGEVLDIGRSVENDLTARNSARRVAYTQGQRYAELKKIKAAPTTSKLVS